MSSSHTADAAGGEAIYSSDGLSPLPVPPPPSLPNRNVNQTIENDTLDSESASAIQAFEVFSGKVFPPPKSSSVVNSSSSKRNVQGNESRLEKLARIQAELEEMEEDNNSNTFEEGGEEEIMGVVKDLSDRLRILQNGTDITRRQKDLTSVVNNLEMKEEKNQDTQIDASSTSKHGGLTQEQRLLRIEKVLGSQTSISNGSDSSVLKRLHQAEEKLNSVDEKVLNQAASRAKVIRADLEAAAKARSKISNTNVEDASKITKLHDQLVDMDGFLSSNVLSTIVNRLSTCASLHTQSMEFGKDLKALEDMVKNVEVTLGSVEESVKSVESGLSENMKVIQKNMEKLDQH